MKVHPRYYGCITLVILSIIVLCFLSCTSTEGFADSAIPDYCGTAGFMVSNGGATILNPRDKNKRLYTKSECNKVEKGVHDGMFACYKLKNQGPSRDMFDASNIDIDYGEKCVGLNAIPSPPPAECMVDGVHIGKDNVAFVNGKYPITDGALRLYTKNECDLLKGGFKELDRILGQATAEEKAKAIQANGKDYGMCETDAVAFSMTCTTNAKPTAAAKAGDAAKSALKDWLG